MGKKKKAKASLGPADHIITIFSDASIKDGEHRGGWGCWVKSDNVRFQMGGTLEGIRKSHIAELHAAANALAEAYMRGAFVEGRISLVVFCIDNMNVVNLINGQGKGDEHTRPLLDQMLSLKRLVGFHWRAKHVKAHSGTHEPRLWVHDLCDRLAKEFRLNGNAK